MLRAKDRPSRADLEQAARLYFEQLQKRIDVQRPFEDETLGQEIDWNLEETRERVRDLDNQLRTNRFGPGVRANAVEMLQSLSLTIPQLSEDLQRLSMQLAARAEREQMRYLEHQLSVPNSSFDPEDDAFHSRSSAVEGSVGLSEPQRQSCTLRENIDQYIRAKERRGLGQSQLDEIGRALNWLVEEIGRETPLAQIRKDQLRHFRDNLQLIDVTLRGREQPFRQRLTNIEANQIRSVTSSRYWRSVAAFFAWATAEGLINQNPAAGLRIEPRKGETKNSPEPFSEGELRKLFATPLYAGYKSPKRKSEAGNLRRRDGHWWSGILPLFTGLRAGELSQLLPSDFAFEAPIPHLKIREENGSGERTKRAKTAASIRDVPLVPMLLDLAFKNSSR
jgi:integrase